MDSRREQIKILITSLMEHLKTWAKEAPTRIGIPEELQKDVDDLLPQFDNKRYESTSLPVCNLTWCHVEQVVGSEGDA